MAKRKEPVESPKEKNDQPTTKNSSDQPADQQIIPDTEPPRCQIPAAAVVDVPSTSEGEAEADGRERLKRHRIEVAGQVWIPDLWGQEELLKDWVDSTVFDSSFVRSSIMSARLALVKEGRMRGNSRGLRIENRC
ncbi:hypothetical protein NMG60_11001445 [Bertholletia excelsa]